MKIICEDYGCGTSSAFVDYGLKNVVHCSREKHDHIFDITGEDLFFVGHEFLLYLWDTERKLKHWQNYKNRKIIWCFEKIDCIVDEWQRKSHWSLERCQQFTDEFVASDEQDCRKYGITFFPQWASRRFYDQRQQIPTETKIVFSGQAGVIGYEKRDKLLTALSSKPEFYVSNHTRKLSWDEYIDNFLRHKNILAPFGNLKAFNTRTFEAIISGRLLLQQVDDEYKWHVEKFSYPNVFFFETLQDLEGIVESDDFRDYSIPNDIEEIYKTNTPYSRFKEIGIEL